MIPTVKNINGELFEATNPIDSTTVNNYVDKYNQALQKVDEAQKEADEWKGLLQTVYDARPEIVTEYAKVVLNIKPPTVPVDVLVDTPTNSAP